MSKKILVVDDSESIREILIFSLNQAGYEVLSAADGLEAVDFFDGRHIDLVLTDYHMPRMNGLELIARVRKIEPYKYVPVLVLTTENQVDKIKEARQAGATGWLLKPFDTEKLMQTLRKVIRQ